MSPSSANDRKKNKIVVKSPTQERSRQTVSTILDACARLLISEGFYSITTDKIAKEAGVSIGSLYQFFGNKESVVQALVKNVMEEDKRIFAERIQEVLHLPFEQKLQGIVNISLETIKRNAELRAKMSTIQYYVADQNYIAETYDFFKRYIYEALPAVPGRDNKKIAHLLVYTFMGLMNTLAVQCPKDLNDPEMSKEISLMLSSYLNQHKNSTT